MMLLALISTTDHGASGRRAGRRRARPSRSWPSSCGCGTEQRTLAAILEDTMGTAPGPGRGGRASRPAATRLSALTVRIAGIFGRVDTTGMPRAAARAGRHPACAPASTWCITSVDRRHRWPSCSGVVTGSPIGRLIAVGPGRRRGLAAPDRRGPTKRAKKLQEQLPDALSLMAASVEGGQTFQRSIDMYRHDARAPLSEELDRVMAEVAVGSDLVVALENMAERSRRRGPQVGRRGGADPAVDRWPAGPDPAHAGRLHADAPGGPPRGADAVGRRAHVGLRALRHPAVHCRRH